MAVKLRLRRMGKKRQPLYKIVAVDSRAPRDGKFIEAVGWYNPKSQPQTVRIDEERALYWLGVGAQPTDTVKSLLRQTGITLKRELVRRGLPEELIQSEMEKWRSSRKIMPRTEISQKKSVDTEGTTEVKGATSEEDTVVIEEKPETESDTPAEEQSSVEQPEVKAEEPKAEEKPAEEPVVEEAEPEQENSEDKKEG